MREDDNEIGHFLRVLRRIIILFAVIIAVPVILSTITAFMRYQVGLPKALTFPNPFATASINAPERGTIAKPTQQQFTPRQASDPQEPGAAERAAPEDRLVVEHPPDAPPSVPSASQTADTSSASSTTPMVADEAHGVQPPLTANDGATAGRADAVSPMQPAPATEAETDVLSASAPLSGPIPLPRPRPHDAGGVRTTDTMPSLVPMPRPRPAAGGSDAQQELTTDSPSAPPQPR